MSHDRNSITARKWMQGVLRLDALRLGILFVMIIVVISMSELSVWRYLYHILPFPRPSSSQVTSFPLYIDDNGSLTYDINDTLAGMVTCKTEYSWIGPWNKPVEERTVVVISRIDNLDTGCSYAMLEEWLGSNGVPAGSLLQRGERGSDQRPSMVALGLRDRTYEYNLAYDILDTWPVAGLSTLLVLMACVGVLVFPRSLMVRMRAARGRCPRCGYPIMSRCAECGLVMDMERRRRIEPRRL